MFISRRHWYKIKTKQYIYIQCPQIRQKDRHRCKGKLSVTIPIQKIIAIIYNCIHQICSSMVCISRRWLPLAFGRDISLIGCSRTRVVYFTLWRARVIHFFRVHGLVTILKIFRFLFLLKWRRSIVIIRGLIAIWGCTNKWILAVCSVWSCWSWWEIRQWLVSICRGSISMIAGAPVIRIGICTWVVRWSFPSVFTVVWTSWSSHWKPIWPLLFQAGGLRSTWIIRTLITWIYCIIGICDWFTLLFMGFFTLQQLLLDLCVDNSGISCRAAI